MLVWSLKRLARRERQQQLHEEGGGWRDLTLGDMGGGDSETVTGVGQWQPGVGEGRYIS